MLSSKHGLAIAALIAQGCLTDPLEGSRGAAQEGTQVEVMLVPLDDHASPSQGAEAFDDAVPATESLEALRRGDGVFVVGVTDDGWGIALVPTPLADDVAAVDDAPGGLDPNDVDDRRDCAGDCAVWCTTALDLCAGDGFELCDCSGQEPDAPAACAADCDEWCTSELDLCAGDGWTECDCGGVGDEPVACAADCGEWCSSSLDLCDGDGWAECDCAGDGDDGDACALDCEEWCSTSLDLCDGDGFEVCSGACGWNEARALPGSYTPAGVWTGAVVVAGVVLLLVVTDPEVQQAIDRGESIGGAVGGVYGHRAEVIMDRLRQAARDIGGMADEVRLPCDELLAERGYRERLEVAAGDRVTFGICSQDRLTVWPRELTIRSDGQSSTDLRFANLGTGFRTWFSGDATVTWTDASGEQQVVDVAEGGSNTVPFPLRVGTSQRLTVRLPSDDWSTGVTVAVTR